MKKVLGVIIALLTVWIILAVFSPSENHISRSVEVRAEADSVFNQINILSRWKNWSYWERNDPKMVSKHTGPASGIGATHQWQSEEMGNGELTIIESNRPKGIKYELRFEGMRPSIGTISIVPKTDRLQITMDMRMQFPFFMRPLGLIADQMIGPDFEDSLKELKKITERP